MIAAMIKALGQLSDPRLRRILLLGLLGAASLYLLLVAAAWWALSHFSLLGGWAETVLDLLGGVAALLLPLLVFPALSTGMMSLWLDDAAQAVEDRHYPHLPPARPQPWTEVLTGAAGFLAVTVGINLLALPVYVVLLFTGFSIVLLYLINGYLLGREYFELVALRRMGRAEARLLFRNRLGRCWLAGAVITFLFSVPLLNLVAPVLATSFMVHLFHQLKAQHTSL